MAFRKKAFATGATCPCLGLTAEEVSTTTRRAISPSQQYIKPQEYVKASEFAMFADEGANAGTVPRRTATGSLIGNLDGVASHANTASKLYRNVKINNTPFNGEKDVTINNIGTLSAGLYLTGDDYNGSRDASWSVDAREQPDPNTVPLRTASGTLLGDVEGNASTASALCSKLTINGQVFDGTKDITITDDATESSQLLNLKNLCIVWQPHIVPRLVLDALSLMGAHDSPVVHWGDTSGSAAATKAGTGTLTLKVVNGFPFVRTVGWPSDTPAHLSLPSVTLDLLHGFTVSIMVRHYGPDYAQHQWLCSFTNGTPESLDVFTNDDVLADGLAVYDGFGGRVLGSNPTTAQLAFSVDPVSPNNTEWMVFSMVRTNGSWVFIRDGVTFAATATPPAFGGGTITWTKNALGARALEPNHGGNLDFAYFSLVEGAMPEGMVHALHRHLKSRV